MIVVFVRQQDRMYVREIVIQHLHSEIRAKINRQAGFSCLNESCCPQSFISWIRGGTNRAVTSYDRYALGGPCTQQGDFEY